MEEKNFVSGSTLYLVATPIGNMYDISLRAMDVLRKVDFIAAEDTRVTMKLLQRLEIKKELVSYYEHNKKERGIEIVNRLMNGESCALVTDAGTPAISDPGEDLVVLCSENNVNVVGIPGPCAAVNALTLSALPTGKFVFEGFLPVKGKERRERLEFLSKEERTMILYEAPHKLNATLLDICKHFGGDRRIALCRELTKLNEEVIRTTLSEAIAFYSDKQPKGEFVMIIEGTSEQPNDEPMTDDIILKKIDEYISDGRSSSDAVKTVSKDFGLPKNTVYSLYLSSKE
ncbi:MAG: 16S rRNA (cytidine(1402)-2'-O)-methyltransferase [Clostridia bacterium]|nr:16S rRNA (cytidine(1402)-2'-O)-methyltransferase [Clostridia bacterium]